MGFHNKKRLVLIGGGVGSLAGVIFEKKFIENIKSNENKKVSANTLHINIPSFITDRTDFLLGKEEKNPAMDMFHMLEVYIDILLNLNFDKVLIAIPCNTFQHPKIKQVFEKSVLQKYKNLPVIFVAMTDAIQQYLQKRKVKKSDQKTVATLGTKATMQLQIYKETVYKSGFNYVDTANFAEDMHDIIYNKKYGLKYTRKADEVVIDKINGILNELNMQNVDYILFSCTELSILLENPEFNKKIPKTIRDKIIDSNHVYADSVAEIYQQL